MSKSNCLLLTTTIEGLTVPSQFDIIVINSLLFQTTLIIFKFLT